MCFATHIKFGTTVPVVAVPMVCTAAPVNAPYVMDTVTRLHTQSFSKPIPMIRNTGISVCAHQQRSTDLQLSSADDFLCRFFICLTH